MPKLNPKIKSIDDLLCINEKTSCNPLPESGRTESIAAAESDKNKIACLPPDSIRAFKNHPFHLYEAYA